MDRQLQRVVAQFLSDIGGSVKLLGERWQLQLQMGEQAPAVEQPKPEVNNGKDTENDETTAKKIKKPKKSKNGDGVDSGKVATESKEETKETSKSDDPGQGATTKREVSIDELVITWREKLKECGFPAIKAVADEYGFKLIKDAPKDKYTEIIKLEALKP